MPVYYFRRINVYVAAFFIAFLIFLLSSPYVVRDPLPDYGVDQPSNIPPDEEHEEQNIEPPNTSGHYNILFAITSTVTAIHRRKLLREELFGIKNNLEPCMVQDGNVYYKFLIQPYKSVEKLALRDFTAESVEYDDIKEFPNISGQKFQESILQWAKGLKDKQNITYNYLVIINDKSIINLEKLQQVLKESSIRGSTLTQHQKKTLVWGSFMSLNADNMAIILGYEAVDSILDSKDTIKVVDKNFTNPITQTFQYYQKYPNESKLYLVNDDVGIIEFPNAVENILIEETVAVGHLFLDEDLVDVVEHLSIPKTLICHPRNPNKLNIAVVTSSFVYNNLCMLPALFLTGENKRDYARKHGYSFVGRSAEFSIQEYKRRKTVWGKFDAIEKVLPHYDWIFWLDMDTVIMNYNVTIEGLFDKFIESIGREQFENKHLIVARPVHDVMINAGVFLMRNSEWSRDFLRLTQKRRDLYLGGMYEQRAMWDLMRQPEWAPGTLFLDQDDRTFNTFPSRYIRGDFVVHYAPDNCPAKPIIDAIGKKKLLENDPDMKISLDHLMDH